MVGLKRSLHHNQEKETEIKIQVKILDELQDKQDNLLGYKTDVPLDLQYEKSQIFAFQRILGLPSENKSHKLLLTEIQRKKLSKEIDKQKAIKNK